ncbi:UDP-N-acetylglucosamine 1-carboxyvinyltransferase [Keratinibaculum paraultunense]|uniref:UDP-N-acetylglucosamine 1-carboxyvinyltransferase n=1 Tax=Keratinibaculum paraultunense TaxID=1278232 RepID=A0A4R3KU44_9FIRM|nr:UDP-N-acetylglucosamine 1-carboxyvinyltransferase [Keratinibaculum paraultunense]QQY79173.1 UDP-N-acetylglucosamine 1-carboxyvinyltransferase [Keratinibaculum paraultunense]TCS88557.1 UDP-N-acetylglucosamine 1-carboxyvinyltransferase [Keratinibaculum paraultunense]
MDKIMVEKSPPLKGNVRVSGAKNSALPILAASLLGTEDIILEEVPRLKDVDVICEVLTCLGAKVEFLDEGIIKINSKNIDNYETPYELMSKMRASFLVMGPLLTRLGKTKTSLPGGCAIGTRPIDLHLKGFKALGAEIDVDHGNIGAYAKRLVGDRIYLDFPSVGATENIMMAAVMAEGETIIDNAAMEPEIVDLSNFLNKLGADVKGAGTSTIKIKGVKKLGGATHSVIPDRIEAGTFMVAGAITKGDVVVENVISNHIKPVIAKLREVGCKVYENGDSIRVVGTDKLKATDIKTLPYPGFPTDMQAQFMALMTICEGTSVVIETVFENRFMHVDELKRMGADIKIDGRSAIIQGVDSLMGAPVKATDLRAGAALVLAGLVADGITEIGDVYHIDRGYEKIEEKFKRLGANIYRVEK